jgi:ADP-ribosylglycohydrolase
MKNKIFGGILGLSVADALGVPVEFKSREELKQQPVTDMLGYGTYNQPPGTWSDDTSLALCLLDSLANGLDYYDVMRKFHAWFNKAEYTPHGEVFDIGFTTRKAIKYFAQYNEDPTMCGGMSENDNGNGSIMRILPLVFYLRANYGDSFNENNEAVNIIHDISAFTHSHQRSQISCGIYIFIANELISSGNIESGVKQGIYNAIKYYENSKDYFKKELPHFQRFFSDKFKNLPEKNIKSGGYVVDTLEAAVWCLLNTDTYESCVLKAVNLGGDTDTVAAVAGGLAGICYGLDAIPSKWKNELARIDYINALCEKFYISLNINE